VEHLKKGTNINERSSPAFDLRELSTKDEYIALSLHIKHLVEIHSAELSFSILI
jgi:hypothetical protein